MFEQPEEKKSRKRWFIPIAIVAVIATVAIGLIITKGANADPKTGKAESASEASDEKAPIPVEVAEARAGSVSSYIGATANLVAENEVQVLAEIQGRVSRFHFEEGSRVSRGTVLVSLVSDEEQILLDKATARAENARASHERAIELAGADLLSRTDFDKTAMERRVADQELAEAQYRLSRTVIRAPIAGVVTIREVRNGQNVRPGDPLYTITDLDSLIADIYLPEREAMALTRESAVRMTAKADPSLQFAARIQRISPVVDRATGTVKVTVEASEVPGSIRPGAFVQVDIVKQTRPAAIVVPREAVIRELQSAHLFVAEEGKAVRRDVKLGIEESELVEILEGVRAGEQVIVAGQGGLKEGAPVRILSGDAS
jgi:membrane fusion protein, multidrug efflux system